MCTPLLTYLSLSFSLSLSILLSLSLSLFLYEHVRSCMGYVWTDDPRSPLLAVYLYAHLCPLPSFPSVPVTLALSLSLLYPLLRATDHCVRYRCARLHHVYIYIYHIYQRVCAPRPTRTPLDDDESSTRGESRVRVPPRLFNGPSFELLAGRANGLCLDHLRA